MSDHVDGLRRHLNDLIEDARKREARALEEYNAAHADGQRAIALKEEYMALFNRQYESPKDMVMAVEPGRRHS